MTDRRGALQFLLVLAVPAFQFFGCMDSQDTYGLPDDDDVIGDDDDADACLDWTSRYDNGNGDPDLGTALVQAADGVTYVAVRSVGDDWDFATVAYDTRGREIWAERFSLAETPLRDVPKDLLVDSDAGLVYVIGESVVDLDEDIDCVVLAYDMTTGERQWLTTYSSGSGSGLDMCKLAVLDGAGRLLVAGLTEDKPPQLVTPFTLVLDSSGHPTRDTVALDTGGLGAIPHRMVLGPDGAMYLAGVYDPASLPESIWLTRITLAGEADWWQHLPSGSDSIGAIKLDIGDDGTLVLGATSWDTDAPYVAQAAAISPDGQLLWSHSDEVGDKGDLWGIAVAADGDGGAYIATSWAVEGSPAQCRAQHLDDSGSPRWSRVFGDEELGCFPMAAVTDGADYLAFSGSVRGEPGSRYFLQIMDGSSGEPRWSESGPNTGEFGELNELTLDEQGHLLATGADVSETGGTDAITLHRYGGDPT